MKFLRNILDKAEQQFEKGKPLEPLYPLFEATDTFLFSPGTPTSKGPHVRDSLDLKRLMSIVIFALLPCLLMGIYNTGLQILLAQGEAVTLAKCFYLGALKVLPVVFVSYAVGGLWETVFALVRKHEINEGFLVTGMLFPLTLPASIPLWQVAVGISFGVVIGKEIFGGTGMNVLNPALTARVFLFFSYPAQISGDKAWVAVDGYSKATPLGVMANAPIGQSAMEALGSAGYTVKNMFLGTIPGSIGETSALACLIGLAILIITGVGSWRIMAGSFIGTAACSLLLMSFAGSGNPMYTIPPYLHMIMGSFAFGTVYMATDPVSAAATNAGRWIYGLLIGALLVIIRTINPAYPEGVMLAILFMNVMAPVIDHFVVEQNIKRRLKRVQA